MINRRLLWLIASAIMLLSTTANSASLQTVKAKTFDDEKFVFPADIKATPLALVFLAMSGDRDNGQLQQQQLLDWHQALQEQGILNEQVSAYHFPVMKSPPFFVKGIISNAMAEVYENKVAMDHAGVLYVKDLPDFANQAELTLDELPTLVLLSTQGEILAEFKGVVSEQGIADIAAAISRSSKSQ